MWIQVLVTALFSMLATVLPALGARLLTALGFGWVTYELGDFAMDSIFNLLKSEVLSLDPDLIGLVALSRFDDAIGILFGGFVASLTLKMTAQGTIKKFGSV